MDKQYVMFTLRERIEVLKKRYRNYCNGVDDIGAELSYGSAAVGRSNTKKELHTCMLIEELVSFVKEKEIPLSDEAEEGLDKIMEPIERHRRLLEND